MREWQKPTIDETESAMEATSYLPESWIVLSPLSHLGNVANGDPAKARSPFRFFWRELGSSRGRQL